jgi:hypothetical protein
VLQLAGEQYEQPDCGAPEEDPASEIWGEDNAGEGMAWRELVYFMVGGGLVHDLRRVQSRYPWGCRFRYGLAMSSFARSNGECESELILTAECM